MSKNDTALDGFLNSNASSPTMAKSLDSYLYNAYGRRKPKDRVDFIIRTVNENGDTIPYTLDDSGWTILGLTLTVNPASVSVNMAKIIGRTQTMTSWLEEHWGEELDTISFNGHTAAFIAERPEDGINYSGLTTAGRRETLSYKEFKNIINLMNANAANFDIRGLVQNRLLIEMSYDYACYRGYFENLDTVEDASTPFKFQYIMTFKAEKTIYYFSGNTPVQTPSIKYTEPEWIYTPTMSFPPSATVPPALGNATAPVKPTANIDSAGGPNIAYSNPGAERLSDTTLQALGSILQDAGISSQVRITSTQRTPEAQARVMYDNILKTPTPPPWPPKERNGQKVNPNIGGVEGQKALYGSGGDAVIAEYEKLRAQNLTADQIKAGMTAKINDLGPYNVSHHCSTGSEVLVFDIAPSSLTEQQKKDLDAAMKRAEDSGLLKQQFSPLSSSDPAFHFEVAKKS